MEAFWAALLGAALLFPIVLWQLRPRFPSSPEELRGDNFETLYEGQDRWFGSKEANDVERKLLSVAEDDLRAERVVLHQGVSRDGQSTVTRERLEQSLIMNGFQICESTASADLETIWFQDTMVPASMVFDRKTSELNDFLHEHGWSYQGWKCDPVLNGAGKKWKEK
ncbi:MAG: hypothetical protein AAGI09_10535 [Pseudomonadota bacterium]